jgi:hypothetical protein
MPQGPSLQLYCHLPASGAFAAFDARLRDLAHRLRVKISHRSSPRFGFLSPTVPTVVVVRGGRVVAKVVGEVSERELARLLGEA